MKVLRPSKSFSASEKAAVQRGQGANGDASATPGSNGTTSAGFGGIGNGNTSNKIGMGNAVKSFGKSSGNGIGMGSTGAPSGGHSRAVSSDLGAGTGGQQKGMARAKSSNVVGPASAFSWMMQNGGIAGGIGGGGSGTGKASAVEER